MGERQRSQGRHVEVTSSTQGVVTTEFTQRVNQIQMERGGSLKADSSRNTIGTGSTEMNQFHERRRSKHEEVKEFRNKSRDWIQRKDREKPKSSVSHIDIRKKYQDAFRNLSLELQKKMRSVKGESTEPPSDAKQHSEKLRESHLDVKYL